MPWPTSWTAALLSHPPRSRMKRCSARLSAFRRNCCRTGSRPLIPRSAWTPSLAGVSATNTHPNLQNLYAAHTWTNQLFAGVVFYYINCCIHTRLKLFSHSFHLHRASTWRPPVPHWSNVWRDDSRHKEALPVLQEWHHRCSERPGPRCRHLHILRRPVSCHHLRRTSGYVCNAYLYETCCCMQ